MEDDAIEGDAADPAAEGLTPEADAEAEAAEAEVAAGDDGTVGEGAAPDPFEAPFVERIPAEDVAEATEPPSDDED